MTMFEEPWEKKFYGKYKGFVRDNADPEKRGRVRVWCPQVMGEKDDEKHWLSWATPCFPWLGGLNTLDFGPPLTKEQNGGVEVGVWVEFEGGNPDHPVWVGTFVPAPDPSATFAQLDLSSSSAQGVVGGSLVESPPSGSTVGDINPPKPNVNDNEVRLSTKPGREIVIISGKGGSIVVGPYGVSINGLNVYVNGKAILAAPGEKSFS